VLKLGLRHVSLTHYHPQKRIIYEPVHLHWCTVQSYTPQYKLQTTSWCPLVVIIWILFLIFSPWWQKRHILKMAEKCWVLLWVNTSWFYR
jgi:hypothetical protein